jgi:hypothetical protein
VKILSALFVLLAAAAPARAQSHVYTNADLGRPLDRTVTVSPEILEGMTARQFTLPPMYPSAPTVVIIGDGRATAGPWEWPPEAYIPIQPLSLSSQSAFGYGGYSFSSGYYGGRYNSPRVSSMTIAPSVSQGARSSGAGRSSGGRR